MLGQGDREAAALMPNRDLKESNRRSLSLQLLSDAAERLWYRLITSVDDFGRLEADPEVVFTTCFQRVPKGWTAVKVQSCLTELSTKARAGDRPLISIYHVGVKSFLQILSSHVHIYQRAKTSKYPPQSNPSLIQASEHVSVSAGGCAQIPSIPESRTPSPESRTSNSEPRTSVDESAQAQATGSVDSFVLTPELEAWSAKEGIHNPGQYVEEFKDHWRSTGGKRKNGQAVKDWAATFRHRLRYLKANGLMDRALSAPGERIPPLPPKTDPIARGQWKQAYGDPKAHGYV